MLRTLSLVFLVIADPVLADPPAITLFDDYKCPAAEPMKQNADGTWTASNARKLRLDCGIAGAQAELDAWRPAKNKATPPPSFQWQSSHTAITVTGAVVALLTAYVQNRTARKLPILP